jgi:hypothetical protein
MSVLLEQSMTADDFLASAAEQSEKFIPAFQLSRGGLSTISRHLECPDPPTLWQ